MGLARVKHRTGHQLACPLVWISPIGARDELTSCTKAKTSVVRVSQRKFYSGECLSLGRKMLWRCFQDILLLTGHRNSPPMCRTRDYRDGNKILCNRCPLKHEVRERGRGEMLYENAPNQKYCHRKTCEDKYNWYLWYMICGMGETIHNRVYDNHDPRYGRNHWAKKDQQVDSGMVTAIQSNDSCNKSW